MAVTWGFLSCMLSLVNNVEQVYAIRALTAFVEASTFSGSHYLLGSWYRHGELGKRSALFACSAQLSCAFVAERSPLISRSSLLRHPARRHLRLAQRQRRPCGLAVRLIAERVLIAQMDVHRGRSVLACPTALTGLRRHRDRPRHRCVCEVLACRVRADSAGHHAVRAKAGSQVGPFTALVADVAATSSAPRRRRLRSSDCRGPRMSRCSASAPSARSSAAGLSGCACRRATHR